MMLLRPRKPPRALGVAVLVAGGAMVVAIGANEVERSRQAAPVDEDSSGVERRRPAAPHTDLATAIRESSKDLQHCYRRALRDEPDLRGQLGLTLAIDPLGWVELVDVDEDTLGSSSVLACAREKITGWRMPSTAPELPAVVPFTIVFGP